MTKIPRKKNLGFATHIDLMGVGKFVCGISRARYVRSTNQLKGGEGEGLMLKYYLYYIGWALPIIYSVYVSQTCI